MEVGNREIRFDRLAIFGGICIAYWIIKEYGVLTFFVGCFIIIVPIVVAYSLFANRATKKDRIRKYQDSHSKPDTFREEREQLQKQLARHEQNLELLIERKKSAQSPQDVAYAIIEIQQWITYLRMQISELGGPEGHIPDDRISLDEAIIRQPDNPDLYVKRARLNYNVPSHHAHAILDCERALKLLPDYPPALLLHGMVWQANYGLKKATRDFRRIVALDVNDACSQQALSYLAAIFNQQRKYRKSIRVAKKALDRYSPPLAHTLDQIAFAYEQLGGLQTAIKYYTQILDLDPTWTNYIRPKRAKLLHQIGSDELALLECKAHVAAGHGDFTTYDLLVKLEPSNPYNYYSRSLATVSESLRFHDQYKAFQLMKEKRVSNNDAATFVEIGRAIVRDWPTNDDPKLTTDHRLAVYQDIANITRSDDDYSVLFAAFREAIQQDAWAMKRPDLAIKWAEQQLSIAQSFRGHDARNNLRLAYDDLSATLRETGQINRALPILHEAIQRSFDFFGRLCWFIVKDLYEKGQYDETAAQLKIIGKHYSDASNENQIELAVTVCNWLAGAYAGCHELQIFNLEEARRFARKACELSPHLACLPSEWTVSEALTPGRGANEDAMYGVDSSFDEEKDQRFEQYIRQLSPHVTCATRLWAISEALTPGDGDKEVAKYVTDPIIREQARTKGSKEIEQLGISAKVAI